ncbi:hypothetical protein D9756_008907 [Leucocoprinus leucothites]|uniref:Uncharacterized protein n=1 Tax=Leucocoprinus leucothites TaxID=201217 RepID=A0A8H5CX67_9AGAR|nr:hypothetical protein D9756_008907 [Leucoagaricus leucothites]
MSDQDMVPPQSTVNDSNDNQNLNRLAHLRTKPLTPKQERRLVAYLDDQFLQLTRGYKKRTSPSTHVPTLHTYIIEAQKLLSFILQIPPVDPSTELRTQFMLRLMGDCLSAVVGYGLVPPRRQRFSTTTSGMGEREEEDDGEPRDYTSALREVLDWLDDLDQAWIAVLQSQVWDPEMGEGVDLVLAVNETMNNGEYSNGQPSRTLKSTPISQTDVTRLRSLLVASIADLEEWLSQTKPPPSSTTTASYNGGGNLAGEDDVASMLERLGVLDEFDDLFSRTMDFLGGFMGGSTVIVEPEAVIQEGVMGDGEDMEDEDEDMSDMVEVVMSGGVRSSERDDIMLTVVERI